jgi:NADH-quinone oxidoreductase subunit J
LEVIFFLSAIVAILATIMVITRLNAIHGLLYLIVSFLAIAVVFFTLGAPFVAALEVIIYAGAIMVLFLFVVMMLNLGPHAITEERQWFRPTMLIGPGILGIILLLETLYAMLMAKGAIASMATMIVPRQVGTTLYGPYLLGVELSSLLLLAGLVGAYYLARR